MNSTETVHESKTNFLNAALGVIRAKGYTATRVEDICDAAGLTKGSFFYHFDSKEDLALAAVDYWNLLTGELFASAPYRVPSDPLDRLFAYIDFRKELLRGSLSEFTCLAGTMLQEIYETHPQIREACKRSITAHAATLEPDIAEAMHKYGIEAKWTPSSLALHTQAVIQGAFVLAKASGGPEIAAQSLDHLKRYVQLLFAQTRQSQTGPFES